eukprot:1363236-Amphidinium_carterae.1
MSRVPTRMSGCNAFRDFRLVKCAYIEPLPMHRKQLQREDATVASPDTNSVFFAHFQFSMHKIISCIGMLHKRVCACCELSVPVVCAHVCVCVCLACATAAPGCTRVWSRRAGKR